MGAAVFMAMVAAGGAVGVSVCRGNKAANAFYSLCIPQPRKPGALMPILVPGNFPCMLTFTDNTDLQQER